MIKKKFVIIFLLLIIAGLTVLGFQSHLNGESEIEINMDNEGTNYFVDGWCEKEAGAYLSYSPCDVKIEYTGTLHKGELIITVYDNENKEVYSKRLQESGEYEDTISFHCSGDKFEVFFNYSEGSSGFFTCRSSQYVSNFKYLFNIGRKIK